MRKFIDKIVEYLQIRISRNAFTLAEVLITLAVIGIVAALTIPTLVQSYKKHVIETRLKKFYSMMNQAIKLSEVENGEFKTWDKLGTDCKFDEETGKCIEGTINALNWYNKYLKDYLRVVKVDTQRINSERVKCILYFPDGTVFSFSSSGAGFYLNASDYEYCEKRDEKYNSNTEICCGIKYFTFYFYQDDLHSSALDVFNDPNTDEEKKMANCNKTGGPPTVGKGAYCTYFIKKNGWKIPKDYPWKF